LYCWFKGINGDEIEIRVKHFGSGALFLQRFLQGAGFYKAKLEGIYGKNMDAAIKAFEERTEEIANALGKFNFSSEKNIGSLHRKAQQAPRVFLKKVQDVGIDVRIISDIRTYAEQNTLFRQVHFGNPSPVVTKAKGG